MQINRLFEIVYLLLNKKKATAKELAQHFEVSTRTILRDIDALSFAGIPIYTTQGKGGGISIMEGFVLNKAMISEEEQNQILFALQSLAATRQPDAQAALGKLKSLFDKTDVNWIEVDFSRWGSTAVDREKFELLKNAILKKQALSFSYASSYGNTGMRTVYPLKLIFKSKYWYLQAWCLPKNNYRTFKINRMRELTLQSETFADREFAVPPMEPEVVDSPCLHTVKLRFSQHMAYRVYDEFSERDIVQNEDGSFAVELQLPCDEWLAGYLLSFGDGVEVLQPQSMRALLTEKADNIKNIYKKNKT